MPAVPSPDIALIASALNSRVLWMMRICQSFFAVAYLSTPERKALPDESEMSTATTIFLLAAIM